MFGTEASLVAGHPSLAPLAQGPLLGMPPKPDGGNGMTPSFNAATAPSAVGSSLSSGSGSSGDGDAAAEGAAAGAGTGLGLDLAGVTVSLAGEGGAAAVAPAPVPGRSVVRFAPLEALAEGAREGTLSNELPESVVPAANGAGQQQQQQQQADGKQQQQ